MAEPPVTWSRAPDALWRALAGTTVVRSGQSGEFVTLRAVANLVWLALEYPGVENEIVEDIEAALGQPCQEEVADALIELDGMGIVVTQRPPT